MYTAVLLYSTSRFVLFLGFCQSLQHNPRWPRYACYLWCVSQHCQSGATRSGWEGTDSTGAQKRINQSLPSSPSSYCCWLSSKFSCRRRKTEENFWMNQIIHLTAIQALWVPFFWANSTGNLMEWQNSACVCIWSLGYWTQSCSPQLQWLKDREGFIPMAGCSHLPCLFDPSLFDILVYVFQCSLVSRILDTKHLRQVGMVWGNVNLASFFGDVVPLRCLLMSCSGFSFVN